MKQGNNSINRSVNAVDANIPQKTISVDGDFGGDLGMAIAAASDGDVVKLGNKVYYTDGITIDKDITIAGAVPNSKNLESVLPTNGSRGSVINGNGTSSPIISLNSAASGTTIQDIEITNGNTGILSDAATNLKLHNLEIHNIGIDEPNREGKNNIAISLSYADGFQIINSDIHNVGRKGIGINDTDAGIVSNNSLQDINLAAKHAQSHDAGGIKLFNTNEIIVKDNNLSDINAFFIWNDITNSTTIENNNITGVGEDFLAPDFNQNVTVSGIYNEKSYESIVRNNYVDAIGRFLAFDATEFTTETMTLEDNYFSSMELNSTDYWANQEAEKQVAMIEDPAQAGLELFVDDLIARMNRENEDGGGF